MNSAFSKILVLAVCLFQAVHPLYPLAPRSRAGSLVDVQRTSLDIARRLVELSAMPVGDLTLREKLARRMQDRLLPEIFAALAPLGIHPAKRPDGSFEPVVFDSSMAGVRNGQSKLALPVEYRGETVTIIYTPQNIARNIAGWSRPEFQRTFVSVFDSRNRKFDFLEFLKHANGEPAELPQLPIPVLCISRIGGGDGVSNEAINRIEMLLAHERALADRGMIRKGQYRIHVLTGDYTPTRRLEQLREEGRLMIREIKEANPDRKSRMNRRLFMWMFGINDEEQMTRLQKSIEHFRSEIDISRHSFRNLKQEIFFKRTGNLESLQQDLRNLERQHEQQVGLLRKKLRVLLERFRNNGKVPAELSIRNLSLISRIIAENIWTYLEKNPEIELTLVENSSLPFYQSKLFYRYFYVMLLKMFSAVLINHDWPDDRERQYNFDFVDEVIKSIFTELFSPRAPNVSYGSINERDRKYYQRRNISRVTNIANAIDTKKPLPVFDRVEELKMVLLGEEHKDDRILLCPVRPVSRKRIDVAIMKAALLKMEREKAGVPFNVSLVVQLSRRDSDVENELRPLEALADLFGINMVYGAEKIKAHNLRNPERPFSDFDQYCVADYVSFPSDFEGLGNNLQEALYYRLPVAANRYEVMRQDILPKGFSFSTFKIHQDFEFNTFVSLFRKWRADGNSREWIRSEFVRLYRREVHGIERTVDDLDAFLRRKEAFLKEHPDSLSKKKPGDDLPAIDRDTVEHNFRLLDRHYSFEEIGKKLQEMIGDSLKLRNIENVAPGDPRYFVCDPLSLEGNETLARSA